MKDGEKFAIVTNYHHLFRALLIAKEEKISCKGYGGENKNIFFTKCFYERTYWISLLKTKASYCKCHLNSIGIYRTDDY